MNWILHRKRLQALYGWLISAVVHLAALILFALLLRPLAGDLFRTIEVQASWEPPGEEIVWFASTAMPTVSDGSFHPGVFTSADPTYSFSIDNPVSTLARGPGGPGSETKNADLSSGKGGPQGTASFFGTQASGHRFVYVLDVSTSMNARGGKRLERAALELLRSIDELYEDQSFYVIVFAGQTRFMFESSGMSSALIPATLENKKRLRAWLRTISQMPGTDPREALQFGLSLHPDCLFLLSDGEFNYSSRRTRLFRLEDATAHELVARVNSMNIPVHTVAFEDQASEPAMSQLASMTHGIHRFVPAPEEPEGSGGVGSRSLNRIVARYLFRAERSGEVAASAEIAERRAAFWLSRGKEYELLNEQAMAAECYRRITREFPLTTAAKAAEQSLAQLLPHTK